MFCLVRFLSVLLTVGTDTSQLAVELLSILVEFGVEPLPAGFVEHTLPKLARLLMSSTEGEVLRPGTQAVKNMLMHDHQQVFAWSDESGGAVVC